MDIVIVGFWGVVTVGRMVDFVVAVLELHARGDSSDLSAHCILPSQRYFLSIQAP